MKKLFTLLTIVAMLSFGFVASVQAQDQTGTQNEMAQTDEMQADTAYAEDDDAAPATTLTAEPAEAKDFQQVLKEKFIEGGWAFMGVVLLTLIFGLALSIERIIYLNLSTTNTTKLLNKVES
ncbi:MAG: MotA/TolQ/ExbB proton channel family protein, partial [Bacteroidales bacterium]|nr:MotA/TolQ/ExbB proton channel family protein [Bacteroidales bacterium]